MRINANIQILTNLNSITAYNFNEFVFGPFYIGLGIVQKINFSIYIGFLQFYRKGGIAIIQKIAENI